MQVIEILGLPFLACITMGTILGYFGGHVLKREIIFIDIALAQVAAVGSIVAHIVLGAHNNVVGEYACSFGCVLLAAAFYTIARKKIVQISLEAVIGVSYAIAAAAALFLVGVAPGGHIHIQNILAGSLLWVTWPEVIFSFSVFSIVGICLYFLRKPLRQISDNYRGNLVKHIRSAWWDFLFYVLLGVVITVAVRIAGIVVVFCYLIIPATLSAVLSSGQTIKMTIAWSVSIAASLVGLLFAYYLDFSVGPAIALILGIVLIIAALFSRLRRGFAVV